MVLTLIAVLVGALLGYVASRLQDRAKAAALRPVVATALMTELQSLEVGLRRLALHKQAASSTIHPDTSNYEAFRSQLVLLKPHVAQALIVFYGLVAEINSSRQRMREEQVELGEDAHGFIRAKAIFAANLVPELRRVLKAAGGLVRPPGNPTWVSGDTDLTLGEPAFDTTKVVRGT